MAAVALSFKLNDNLVHQWRRGRGVGSGRGTSSTVVAESMPQFIALSLPAAPPPAPPSTPTATEVAAVEIRLELKRGAIGVSVTWPISAAAECAAWLREVLK